MAVARLAASQINRAHVAARGGLLYLAADFRGDVAGYDYATGQLGKPVIVSGQPSVAADPAGAFGSCLRVGSTSTSIQVGFGGKPTALPSSIAFGLCITFTSTGYFISTGSTNSGVGLRNNSTSIDYNATGVNILANGTVTVSNNIPYFIGVSGPCSGTGTVDFVVRNLLSGVVQTTSATFSTAGANTSDGVFTIGGFGASSNASSYVANAAIVYRRMTLTELLAWANDPFGLLRPQPSRRWVGSAAAAPIGTASSESAAVAVGAATYAGTGAASASSTAAAVGASTAAAVATALSDSSASAIGAATTAAVGVAAATSAASGTGVSTASGVAAAAATGTAAAIGASLAAAVAAALSNSAATGVSNAGTGVGSAAATSTATGVGRSTAAATATAAATSTALAASPGASATVGAAASTSTATGIGTGLKRAVGTAAAEGYAAAIARSTAAATARAISDSLAAAIGLPYPPVFVQTLYVTAASRFQPNFDGISPGVLVALGRQMVVGDFLGRPVTALAGYTVAGRPVGVTVNFNLSPFVTRTGKVVAAAIVITEATGLDPYPAYRLFQGLQITSGPAGRDKYVLQRLGGLIPGSQYVLTLAVRYSDGSGQTLIAAFAAV